MSQVVGVGNKPSESSMKLPVKVCPRLCSSLAKVTPQDRRPAAGTESDAIIMS